MVHKQTQIVINNQIAWNYYKKKQKCNATLSKQYKAFFTEGNKTLLENTSGTQFLNNWFFNEFRIVKWEVLPRINVHFLRLDMCYVMFIWRLIRGYPINGQSTHTNAKSPKYAKLFYNFRVEQFRQFFNKKKKYNFQKCIWGEYTNRLWAAVWTSEWIEAALFILRLANWKTQRIAFDLTKLAQNNTNGYTRVGAAAKIGKARRNFKTGTLGLPIFFSRYLFTSVLKREFPFLLSVVTEEKKKKKLKKKKNLKKKW